MSATVEPTAGQLTLRLLPFAAVVLFVYAAVALPLAALPLLMHDGLGYGPVAVGVAMGLAPVTTLVTRQFAGRVADRRGTKAGVLVGILVTACSGLAYLAGAALPPGPAMAALLAGRVLLGLGDSLATTAVTAWLVARFGPQHAGRCTAWVGIAMYGALALGTPAGAALAGYGGFAAVAAAVVAVPLLAAPIAAALVAVAPVVAAHVPVRAVIGRMWPPGLGLVFASSGFGTIAAFLSLRFAAAGWDGAGLALTGFGAAYILSRLLLAGVPDRFGGSRVAVACLLLESAGLVLIATAGSPLWALAGTALTGLGYSMVFPALAVETVRRVPPASRGVALGLFLACFDGGLGLAGPAAGLVAGQFGFAAAFLAAAAVALAGAVLTAATRVK